MLIAAQGMSLDRVIVDLSRSFEQSQIYVARTSPLPRAVCKAPRANAA
jgi:hypothetical protein